MNPVDVLSDAEFLPFRLDPVGRRVLFVRMQAEQREQASFLDERAMGADPVGAWLPIEALTQAPKPAIAPHFIFHIGHCGSTLLSRLLQHGPQVQSLREPLPLRTLADAQRELGQPEARFSPLQWQALLHALLALWARPLPGQRHTVIKATSSGNGLIGPVLAAAKAIRAVLLDMALEPYLATLFKSMDSMRDACSAAPERLLWLRAATGDQTLQLHALSLAQQCTMGWLAERLRFVRLAETDPSRQLLRLDFDALLAQPLPALQGVARHFGWAEDFAPRAVASDDWRRYSKAQAHAYGAEERRLDLAESRRRHAPQIAEGLAFAAQLQARHPALAALDG